MNILEALAVIARYKAKNEDCRYLAIIIDNLKFEFKEIPQESWKVIIEATIESLLQINHCPVDQLYTYLEMIALETWTDVKVIIPGTQKKIWVDKEAFKNVVLNQFKNRRD